MYGRPVSIFQQFAGRVIRLAVMLSVTSLGQEISSTFLSDNGFA